jgi:hypothetical protein
MALRLGSTLISGDDVNAQIESINKSLDLKASSQNVYTKDEVNDLLKTSADLTDESLKEINDAIAGLDTDSSIPFITCDLSNTDNYFISGQGLFLRFKDDAGAYVKLEKFKTYYLRIRLASSSDFKKSYYNLQPFIVLNGNNTDTSAPLESRAASFSSLSDLEQGGTVYGSGVVTFNNLINNYCGHNLSDNWQQDRIVPMVFMGSSSFTANALLLTKLDTPDLDGTTITKNDSDELQVIGVIDSNSGDAVKTWSGTTDEYNAITDKDPNTLYNITDDFSATAYEAYSKTESDALMDNKANTDLDNLTSTGKAYASGVGMPSEQYIDLTWESPYEYTAPANGYLYFYRNASTGQYIVLTNSTVGMRNSMFSSSGNQIAVIALARKGDNFAMECTATGTIQAFRFIYAQGEVS